jgi:hypothetical protein
VEREVAIFEFAKAHGSNNLCGINVNVRLFGALTRPNVRLDGVIYPQNVRSGGYDSLRQIP